jgi:hypothetical protein
MADTPAVLLPPLGDGVLIVSGLPRSGTSMIMQMLAAGGMPILTDGRREADDDNPLGYFEFNRSSSFSERAMDRAGRRESGKGSGSAVAGATGAARVSSDLDRARFG